MPESNSYTALDQTSPPRRDELALSQVVDDLGTMLADGGLPRTAGRVLGWLLVSDPPEQSTSDLVTALHASKASVSQATQLLERVGMLERRHVRGSRQLVYRIPPGVWPRLFASKASSLHAMAALAERGLASVGPEPHQRERLEELHELYEFAATEYDDMVKRWYESRGER